MEIRPVICVAIKQQYATIKRRFLMFFRGLLSYVKGKSMKKLILATAVSLAATVPTAAMADITMGGQLEIGIVNASGDGTTEGLQLSDAWEGGQPNRGFGSHFWVKGAHKLSDSLTGLWKLNTIPTWDSGGAVALARRDAFVGLKGGFGTVLLGRINSPYKTSTVKWDPFLATFLQARGNEGMTGFGHNSYLENVVAYAKKFGKVAFVGAIALDESNDNPADTETDADHAAALSLNVPVGPVEIALAYLGTGGIGGSIDGTSDIEAIKLGVKFKTGGLTLAGQYETIDRGGNDAFDQAFVTGSFKASSNTISVSYGTAMSENDAQDDSTYVALGLRHAFSKKFSGLVGVTKTENSGFTNGNDYTVAGISARVKF